MATKRKPKQGWVILINDTNYFQEITKGNVIGHKDIHQAEVLTSKWACNKQIELIKPIAPEGTTYEIEEYS